MKSIPNTFNTSETVLTITSFPGRLDSTKGSTGFNAIGWHAQKTLSHLSRNKNVIICAEENGDPKIHQVNDSMLLTRIWKKGNLLSFLRLFFFILHMREVRSIFVEFEFNIFGGILPNILMVILLGILRLLGKNIFFELHQVITDLKPLEKHVHITNPLVQKVLSTGVKLFYRVLGVSATSIIVFEEALKTRLSPFVNTDKVTVLSLATEKKALANRLNSRRKIQVKNNEFVLLCFGFINGYKGLDWIINSLKEINTASPKRPLRLLIAGGQNPYLKHQKSYQEFYKSIMSEAKKYPHITTTGFVPDADISTYFAAADVVTLPYEVFMSASGPFSLALSYGRPVILSNQLKPYAKSEDFAKTLEESRVSQSEIFFPLDNSFPHRVKHLAKNKVLQKKLTAFSIGLAEKRSSETVTEKLESLLFVRNKVMTGANRFVPSI